MISYSIGTFIGAILGCATYDLLKAIFRKR